MRIVVTGGTGFIGRALCARLLDLGHAVMVLTRDPAAAKRRLDPRITVVRRRGEEPTGEWTGALEGSDAVVNLAGEPVAAGRWTPGRKDRLRKSRDRLTTVLVEALARLQSRPSLLINASAIGFYGPRGDEPLTEEASSGSGFLASLCREWESAARAAERHGTRVVLLRIGVVLDVGGGALAKMLPPFKFGLGGPLGRGTQWMSWIHRHDLIELLVFLLAREAHGPVNATAPYPVTNREFARILGQVLGRPAFVSTPACVMRLLLGEMADELLLTGQRVLPQRAQGMGYQFRYPALPEALHAILQ